MATAVAEQAFFPISEVSTYHPKWIIRARVTSRGQVRSFASRDGKTTQVFDAHLLDESGVEIRANFFGAVAEQYAGKIHQGKCYTFSRGSVRIANRQYNRCNHRYELVFDRDALIEEVADIANIETVKFAFTDLHALQGKTLPCTVDICGVITSFRSPHTFTSKDGKELVKREITLADDTATSIAVALWGERAKQEDKVFEGNPVVCLKGVSVREWNTGRSGSLLESGVMDLHSLLPEAQRVRQWWSKSGGSVNVTSMSGSSGGQMGLVSVKDLSEMTLPAAVDMCGVITSFRQTHSLTSKEGRELTKRELTIADDSANSMIVTIWGDRAKQDDGVFDGKPVVLIKGVLVKEWNGGRSGSLLESGSLAFNPETPEAARVRQWWSGAGAMLSITTLSSTASSGGAVSNEGLVTLGDLSQKTVPCVMDLCGVIVNFKPTFSFSSKDGRELVKREITVADDSAISMVIAIWGERAKQEDALFAGNPTIFIKGVIVKEWNGGRSGSLTESGSLSFNPDTPEGTRVREWWASTGPSASLTALSVQGGGAASNEGLVNLKDLSMKILPCAVELCAVIVSFRSTYSFSSREGRELVKREITVADDSGASMVVTLWGDRAKKDDSVFDGKPLVSLKGVLVKEWNGGRSGSLTEAGSMTLNPETPEAETLRQWMSRGGLEQGLTQLSQDLGGGGGGAGNVSEAMSVTEMRASAEQLLAGEQKTFTVVSRLALVQMQKQGEPQPFYYMACQEPRAGSSLACNRRVTEDGFCAACNLQGKAAPRFNLRCRFSDFGDSCWLTTFHEAAQGVLKQTAEEAKQLETGAGGRDGLEGSIRRRYFDEPLQLTIRAKLDTYNGEMRTNTTCAGARPVNRGAHGRAMLKSIRDMVAKLAEPLQAGGA